mmetsp:Transcript_12992/g.28088  ORF Transcript_12992/g.28088 Transcript_12992/m.28088 type:complete len:503 (+) Transcript_12992:158-1666(+)
MPPSIPNDDAGGGVIVDVDGVISMIENGKPPVPPAELLDESTDSLASTAVGILDDSFTGTADVLPAAAAAGAGAGPAAEMTVMGVYTRGDIPRQEELPEDYGLKDCAQDQIMVRERIKTRPLFEDSDCDGDDDDTDGDADDESDGGTRSSGSRRGSRGKVKKSKRKERTKRSLLRRLSLAKKKREEENDEYDAAMFLPEKGLVMDSDLDWPFYHEDLSEHSDSTDDERVYDERAILWQSIDNYEALMGNPAYSKYFLPPHIVEKEAELEGLDDKDWGEAIELVLAAPRFGEQVIVKGIAAKDIAVGDIFEVDGGHSPLKVEVTSPRLPCSYVDKRNGSPFGMKGVKRFTMTEGLAGWFTRVLVAGELRDGMQLVRTAHPNPKWTLPEISKALYGEGPKRKQMLGYPWWSRSREELEEVCNLKALGRVEWRDEAQWLLDGNESDYERELKTKQEAADKAAAEAAEKEASMDWYQLWAAGGFAACCTGVAIANLCTPLFCDAFE